MTKKNMIYFICLNIVFVSFLGCEAMATLFHGSKPEEEKTIYTVTFDANGANGAAPAPETAASETAVTLPGEGALVFSGKIFTGWSLSPSGAGTTYTPGYSFTVTGNQTFYARWVNAGEVQQYTVTFNANGAASGTPPAPQTVYSGISITVPDQGNLVNTGKTFTGWNTAAGGTGTNYNSGDSLVVSANVTLYAQWLDPDAQRYTMTYHANGASGTAPTAQTVNEGASITLPGAGGLTNSGKTFNGWNTAANGSGTDYAAGASFTVNADTNFYAQWRSEPVTPPGATLAEKFAYIAGQADDGTVYNIEVTQDEYLEPTMVATQGRNVTVNLKSADAGDIKTIQIMSTGTLLTVNNNITLTLQDITLKGRPGNDTVLVKVALGGAMIMNQNAKIIDNVSSANAYTTIGAGLCIDGGVVTMNDGEISGNFADWGYGGGVYVKNGGAMVINAGKITGNRAYYGGGILIAGGNSNVAMHGGEISNNIALANEGGGICMWDRGRFTKTSVSPDGKSGVIYGSSAGSGLANTATDGAAIYTSDSSKRRNDTLGQFDEY
jgi:uncharacterized repeat protein (TIGR02543 family)